MNVLLLQTNIVWEDKEANFEIVSQLLASGDVPGGSLVVLPEMFATGFTMEPERVAEADNGRTVEFLKGLASSCSVCVVGGFVVRDRDGQFCNRAVSIDPGGNILAAYDKMHPFSFSGEDRHYTRGKQVVSHSWDGFRIAPFICYDLRFPEIYRASTLGGAEVLVTIANWPTQRVGHWTALLRARAIENQAYVLGVNRTGTDPANTYPGKSIVFDPKGACLAEAGAEEGILRATLDHKSQRIYRRAFPALDDISEGFREWAQGSRLKAQREG